MPKIVLTITHTLPEEALELTVDNKVIATVEGRKYEFSLFHALCPIKVEGHVPAELHCDNRSFTEVSPAFASCESDKNVELRYIDTGGLLGRELWRRNMLALGDMDRSPFEYVTKEAWEQMPKPQPPQPTRPRRQRPKLRLVK